MQHHFLPLSSNRFTPKLLQRGALLGMFFLAVLTFTLTNVYAVLWQQSNWLVGAVLPAVVVSLTNEERVDLAVPTLVRNPVLDEAARLKAEHMAENGYFAHYSPDGVSPWHWFSVAGYPFVHAGENLAVHFTESDEVVEAWMKSPTHRANIASANYREIGVGTARGRYQGFDTVFVVQLFGTPALPPIRQVVNENTDLSLVSGDGPGPAVAGIEASAVEPITDTPADTPVLVTTALPPIPVFPEVVAVTDVAITEVLPAPSFMASTTNLEPAPILTTAPAAAGPLERAATNPSNVLQVIYILIGSIVIITLITSITGAWKQHKPQAVFTGVLLLVMLSVLFGVHLIVSQGALVV